MHKDSYDNAIVLVKNGNMNSLLENVNIYMVPPLLSLVMGVTLAIISIAKGKMKQENILFSLLCIWWSLTSPIFICHHIFRGNEGLLLAIERSVHFFYVYLPPVTLLFFYKMTGTRSRFILPASFVLSFIISLATFTNYYFYGFYNYSWGYIAKGGIAFHAISVTGSAMVIYLIVFFIRKIRTEKNQIVRLKLKYILLSFIIIGLLTMTNIPAINGIDIYPLGNMMFIPLGFLGYGVLSHRLMDIKSILHVTLLWAVMSSLIIIPNALILILIVTYLATISNGLLVVIAVVWFYANYLYMKKAQPLIDQLFNKRKYDLYKIEASFIEGISHLKTLDELARQLVEVITKSLLFKYAEFVVCDPDESPKISSGSAPFEMEPVNRAWFERTNHLVDKDLVESSTNYKEQRKGLLALFARLNAQYLVPVLNTGRLVGLLVLPEKRDFSQLKRYEVSFINNIRSAFSIAMENAITFSNLNMLKNNLEQLVAERTSELTEARDLLLYDLELAQKIQTALLPQKLPIIDRAEIGFKYEPMMGVGGDFIDILMPQRESAASDAGNALCLFICDVSGHGVSAALTAAMVKMSLASWELNIGCPARHLATISDSLKGKTAGNFITAISCCIYLDMGKLVFANAGHPPLVIIRSDGTAEFLKSKGRLICDYIPALCEDVEVDLHNNDIVVLYTDGIIDESKNHEMYGEGRFVDILVANRSGPLEVLCNAVYDSLIEFKGDVMLDDDFTILAMRYVSRR